MGMAWPDSDTVCNYMSDKETDIFLGERYRMCGKPRTGDSGLIPLCDHHYRLKYGKGSPWRES